MTGTEAWNEETQAEAARAVKSDEVTGEWARIGKARQVRGRKKRLPHLDAWCPLFDQKKAPHTVKWSPHMLGPSTVT